MTEENNNDIVEQSITQFRIEAPEGETIRSAQTLKLVVEGERYVIEATAETVMAFLTLAFGGEVVNAQDGEGNDLMPKVLDPLSTGDDSVPQ